MEAGKVIYKAVRAFSDTTSGQVGCQTLLYNEDEMAFEFDTFHHANIVVDRFARGPETNHGKWDSLLGVWLEMGDEMRW